MISTAQSLISATSWRRWVVFTVLFITLDNFSALASDTWTGAVSANWNNAGNWTAGVPATNPASSFDVIMLGPGHTTNTADTFHYFLSSLQFPSGAPSFLIHVKNVTISGPATNDSGLTQTLEVDPGHLQGAILVLGHDAILGPIHIINDGGQTLGGGGPNEGGTTFFEAGTVGAAPNAGQATIDNNAAAVSPLGSDHAGVGSTEFHASSTAGSATINNHGGVAAGAGGGFTEFFNTSTAGNATIHNIGASGTNASAGRTFFRDSSGAGGATIINDGTSATGFFTAGFTDFSGSSSAQNATIINDNAGVE